MSDPLIAHAGFPLPLAGVTPRVPAYFFCTGLAPVLKPRPGPGYLSGEPPYGLTTVKGSPASVEVRVVHRPVAGYPGDGVLVATSTSASDGTWRIDGLDPTLEFDVVFRRPEYNDMILSRVNPKAYPPMALSGGITAGPNGFTLLSTVTVSEGTPPFMVHNSPGGPPGLNLRAEGRDLVPYGDLTAAGSFDWVTTVTDRYGAQAQVACTAEDMQKEPDVSFKACTQSDFTVVATTTTCPWPALAQGDLLVLAVMHRQPLTAPGGWELVTTVPIEGGNPVTLQWHSIFTRVANGDEVGGLTLTQEAAGRILAACLSISCTGDSRARPKVKSFISLVDPSGVSPVTLLPVTGVDYQSMAVAVVSAVAQTVGSSTSSATGSYTLATAATSEAARLGVAVTGIIPAGQSADGQLAISNATSVAQTVLLIAVD